MNFTNGISWRRATVIAAATLALAAAACGGDDSAGGNTKTLKTLDIAQADSVSHQALLVVSDLPGTGWTVKEDDKFEESPNAATTACQAINAKRDEARKKSDPERAGRARRAFTRDGKDTATDIDVQVNIFNTAAIPAATLRLQREAYDENLRQCFSDTLKEGADPTVKIDVKDIAVLGKLPGEGVGRALDVSISDDKESLNIRLETYNWRFANAGVTVNISGNKDDITPALVKGVLDAAQAKLEKLAK